MLQKSLWAELRSGLGLAIVGTALAGTAADAQSHPRYTPDGQQIAHFSFNLEAGAADLQVSRLADGVTQPVETGQVWSVNPTWAPDGQGLVFIAGPGGMSDVWDVFSIDLVSGAVEPVTRTPEREMHTQLSVDGRHLVFIRMGDGPDVWMRDVETGQEWPIAAGQDRDFHPKWSRDGTSVVFDRTSADGRSMIWRAGLHDEAGEMLAEAPDGERLSLPDISETGAVYAIHTAQTGSTLVRLDPQGTVTPVLTAAEGERLGGFDIRPDGQAVAITITDEGGRPRLYQIELSSGARTLVFE